MDSKDLEACGFGLGRACQLELRAPISLPLCLSDAWILPNNVYLAKWREMNLLYFDSNSTGSYFFLQPRPYVSHFCVTVTKVPDRNNLSD